MRRIVKVSFSAAIGAMILLSSSLAMADFDCTATVSKQADASAQRSEKIHVSEPSVFLKEISWGSEPLLIEAQKNCGLEPRPISDGLVIEYRGEVGSPRKSQRPTDKMTISLSRILYDPLNCYMSSELLGDLNVDMSAPKTEAVFQGVLLEVECKRFR